MFPREIYTALMYHALLILVIQEAPALTDRFPKVKQRMVNKGTKFNSVVGYLKEFQPSGRCFCHVYSIFFYIGFLPEWELVLHYSD